MALRTPLSVTPHLYMGDSTGRPLDMGTVYFGEQDKDPEFYPINLFSDDALTLPLAQPVHTKGGYLYDKGDMVEPHAKEFIYSVKVLDSYGRKVFYKGAMMRNSWNDDVIEQINTAIIDSADAARQVAIDITNDAINNTAVEGGVLADTFVVVDGSLSQRTINKGLESIADLSTINNPKDGLRVYVKSYHAGLNKGGGTFIYDSSKSSINNEGTIINGWVRHGVTGTVTPQMFGAIGNGREGDQACISKAYEYLNSIGGGTLYIPNGLYLIHEVNYVDEIPTSGVVGLDEQYAFPMYSNITVLGQCKANTIFKMQDGITYKDPTRARLGCALFADAHLNLHVENFKLSNFKVDMNGSNNLQPPNEDVDPILGRKPYCAFPVVFYFDYYASDNIVIDNLWVHENSGHNSIVLGHKCRNSIVKNCLFTDHSDYIVGNEHISDHSTIYIAGLDNKVHDNVFLMNHNPVSNVEPTRFSTVSTAIEAHGVNTVVSNNIVDGYGAPFLAASTEWYNGDRVLFTGNIAYNAVIGFAWNTMKGNLHATFEGNYVSLRKQKASTADNYLRYAHAAVESMGAVNSVLDYADTYGDVFIKNNVFVQTPASDWSHQDIAINVCMNVKEARIFEATGNTFVNFKSSVYTALAHRDWLNAKHTLKANTYINCGDNTNYSLYAGAYTLSNGDFTTEKEYTFNLLESISISDETFVDCKYGVLLVKQGDLTAKTISLTGINYLSGFIVPMMVAKGILTTANHSVNIEYTTTGVPDATQSLPNIVGLTSKLKMHRWSNVTDTYLLDQIEYLKPAYYGWNVHGYGLTPTVGVQYGAFPNVTGDIVDLKTPALNGFSRYTFFEGSWYGTGKIEVANKLL